MTRLWIVQGSPVAEAKLSDIGYDMGAPILVSAETSKQAIEVAFSECFDPICFAEAGEFFSARLFSGEGLPVGVIVHEVKTE